MRILSLGFALPGAAIDNFSFANAPSFFDYDALLVDPLALSVLIEQLIDGSEEQRAASGERIVNGAGEADTVALAGLLRDRRDETARLLSRDGIVVCFAQPNVAHDRVADFDGCDRYCWLPAPAGLAYDEPFLRRGNGSEIDTSDEDHPFAPFVRQLRGSLAYRAYFDNAPATHVFARSAGGAAVSVELSVAGGRVVFLPAPARSPTGEQRYAYAQALQSAIGHTLRLAATTSPPPWLAEYDLPGLTERQAAHEKARQRVEEAQEALSTAGEHLADIDGYRRLLWQEGKYGLDEPVRRALTLIGFKVFPDDLDEPAQVQLVQELAGAEVLLLEIEASTDAAGIEGHHRLRRRIEESIAQGAPKRGLLIINGHRTRAPSERPPQYDDALRIASESLRYCVATTEQLYHAVRAALESDDATVTAFRELLLTAQGILTED